MQDDPPRESVTTEEAVHMGPAVVEDGQLPVPLPEKGALSNAAAGRALGALGPRPFVVQAIWLMLLLQAAVLLVAGYLQIDWTAPPLVLLSNDAFYVGWMAVGVLALLAAVNCGLLRPRGWLEAMLTQGAFLALALAYYLRWRPEGDLLFYGLLLFSVVIVVYLHYADVPVWFGREI